MGRHAILHLFGRFSFGLYSSICVNLLERVDGLLGLHLLQRLSELLALCTLFFGDFEGFWGSCLDGGVRVASADLGHLLANRSLEDSVARL